LKLPISLALFLFLAVLVVIPLIQSSSTLTITVETSKPSYYIGESIEVHGNLTLDGSPVQNELVALAVHDPNDSPVVIRTLQTDTYGLYNITFELSVDALLGTYTVYVSATHGGENATNKATFGLNKFVLTIQTDKESYHIGEAVNVYGDLTLNDMPVINGLIALEVKDPESSTVVIRTCQTDANGTYKLIFNLSPEAKLGNYTVYVSSGCEGAKATNKTTFEVKRERLSTDVNGDGVVNILDVAIVAKAYGSYPGHPRWNPAADMDSNEIINILDVARVAKDYGKTV
jgi:uncharacterized protein YfaS (alpha-2-macroglobulin family)